MPVSIVIHPLIKDCLARLRHKETGTAEFRAVLGCVSLLLIAEAVKDIPLVRVRVETPLASRTDAETLGEKKIVAVPVIRAGVGMLDAFLHLFPSATIRFVGLKRDEQTFTPHEYYHSLPADLSRSISIILDPMLATGGSLVAAVTLLKQKRAKDIRAVTLVAAPEGVERVERSCPSVQVYTASIDKRLNTRAYIVPGIGDAGDRFCGTE